MHQLRDFQHIHQGSRIVVCGCGRSLLALEDPKEQLTIGVNDVGRHFTPDYLVALNYPLQYKGDRYSYIRHSRARFVFSQLDLPLAHSQLVQFTLGQRGGTDISESDKLPYTQNSPYVAVCLAAMMGASEIGLLGVDFTEHHFFARSGRHILQSRLAQIDKEYGNLQASLARLGISLVNLSQSSLLQSLPKSTLENFRYPPVVHY